MATEKTNFTQSLARLADSAKNLAIIAGVAVTIFGFYKGYEELVLSARSQKLSSFATVKELIKSSEEQEANINKVLAATPPISQRLESYSDTRSFYHSDDAVAAAMSQVGHHYEQLGALVRLRYIDFDLLYEVVPFPDAFWDATAPVRTKALSNWSNGKGLPDFWRNFQYLRTRYDEQRAHDAKR